MFIIFLVLIFTFTGCEKEGWKGIEYKINTYEDFIEALMDRNYTIKEIKPTNDEESFSFFTVDAKNIELGGDIVSIYEFETSNDASTQSERISKDGYSIGNSQISWVDTPHFFKKGKLIVSYIGSNKTLIFDLSMILGKSITE